MIHMILGVAILAAIGSCTIPKNKQTSKKVTKEDAPYWIQEYKPDPKLKAKR
jgi:hypothetical protein